MSDAEAVTTGDGKTPKSRRLPGEEGVWVLVLGDMLVFALFYIIYLYYRGQQPALFDASQTRLNLHLGVINTLLLLTSSWFVVMGVESIRGRQLKRAQALLGLAFLCGASFVGVKAIEYVQKFQEGLSLVTNDFFMYYFMYTGIHLVHVLIGLAVLGFLCRRAPHATPADAYLFESGAIFWHMVDLLWIMLFPLLYLVKR